MQTPEEFLEANGLETRTIDRAGLVAAFQKEMEAGLAGEPSSLKMIPTFTSPYGEVTKDTPVTVLDAGGTNFRAGTVTIPSDGSEIKIEHVEKGEMPGAKSYVSQEDFYAVLTGHVQRCAPFVKDNAVGFCFSYPAEASAEGDAKLLHWTKQIQAPEIVGQWVGAEMAKRLDPKPSKITVVNDTVATLLAGKAVEKDVHYSAYLGFILGTGTNVAYIEKNSNIGKLKHAPEGYMAINTESGGFNKIAQSKFDEAMDKKSADCGTQRFEKMIAGAYLGRIGLEVFKAAAREGFFSEDAKLAVLQMGALESYDLDNFCAMYDNGKPNPLLKVFVDEKDRATARRLATPVFERAAILTAIHLAAFIIKTGGGTDPYAPVNVCIDGSTYYKTRAVSFPEIVKRELDAMLAARNISYALTVCPDCARKAKLKAVLWTIPITLIATPVLVFLSLFAVRPNRNIRSEVTSWPITVPIVAVIFWLCGLSVYLPRPKELYAAELVRKRVGKPGSAFLVPLEPRCYTRREKPVKPSDITYRTALQSDLAEKLTPVINGEADAASLQALVGQTFIKEERARW